MRWMNEVVLATLALLVIVTGGWYYFTQHEASEVVLLGDRDCTGQSAACMLNVEGLQVKLILPDRMVPLEKFPVRIELQGQQADGIDNVTVDFAMRGMDMGLNRYRLAPVDEAVWSGEAILPVCVTGRSDWEAVISLHGEDGVSRARFGFQVENH